MKPLYFELVLALVLVTACSRTPDNSSVLVQILKAEDTRVWNGPEMDPLLASEDPQIRQRAARAAGRIGDTKALARLTGLLNDDVAAVAATAAFAIGEIESTDGAATLIQALTSKSNAVRAAAIEGLGKIGAAIPEEHKENRKSIGDSIVIALKDPGADREFTLRALTAALRVKPEGGPAAIAVFLSSPDPRIREDALNALARLRAKESLDKVRSLLKDPDALTRANAARVLGAAKDKAAVDALITVMSEDTDLRTRVAAVRAIGAIGDPAAAAVLLDPKRRFDPNEFLEVATAMGLVLRNTGNANAIAILSAHRDHAAAPEIEMAYARIAPEQYVGEPSVKTPAGTWLHVAAIAQGLGELAEGKVKERALSILRTLAQSPATPEKAMPDVLQALKAFKPEDLGSIALNKLKTSDVITRAAAADVLGELPKSEATVQALTEALRATEKDKQNDAELSIKNALEKLTGKKEPKAAGPVKTRNTEADYRRAAARQGKHPKATIMTDKGVITLQLYPDDAPLTVDSFIQLANAHYFDGLTFHRVVPNFVIQGGDPRGDGNGGPGYQIRCEINTLRYDIGAVGMALSGKDTGGSQFFITHSPQPHLDGGYTVFAMVTSPPSVAEKIERGDRIRSITIQE